MKSNQHPADSLGDARTFGEAIARLIEAIDYEVDLIGEDTDGDWDRRKEEARQAVALWYERVTEADRLAVQDMRERGLEDFASALESGDWSRMAF